MISKVLGKIPHVHRLLILNIQFLMPADIIRLRMANHVTCGPVNELRTAWSLQRTEHDSCCGGETLHTDQNAHQKMHEAAEKLADVFSRMRSLRQNFIYVHN